MPLQASAIEAPQGNILMLLNTTTDQRGGVSIPTSFAKGTPLAALAAGSTSASLAATPRSRRATKSIDRKS